ncbi:MAG TPA: putative porin, partial [Chryseolinea sp.]|nr:putative porin [Chryseolinea sp.]
QQYEIGKALQLYNTFDRYRQGTEFTDIPANAPTDYYDYTDSTILVMGDTTQGLTKFRTIRDEVGFKGNLLKLFYQGYYAARWYNNENLYAGTVKGFEHYLGGRMSLRLDSLGELSAWLEVQNNGNFRIEGELKSKWFEASLKQLQYSVPIVYQTYKGLHNRWENDFNPINVTQLNGYLHYNSPVLSLSPGLTFTRLGNYVFMKYYPKESESANVQTMLPTQSSGEQVIASPELKFSLTMLRHVHLRTDIIYTKLLVSNDDAIQIPELFVNTQLSYENIHFNDNLDIHTGLEIHYQSDYNALAYDVPMQLYYVQNTDVVKGFPLIDVFVSARIKRGKIFFKYNNIVQAFTKEGYFLTPEYPGQRNILDFGFDWSFYD